MQRFIGTGVALVTPFNKQLQVDFHGLEKLLAHVTANGVNYLVVHGTTGEATTTSPEEKAKTLAFVQTHNSKQLPIVLGISGNSTQAILKAISITNWQGIDAVMVASPYYNRPSQEGIYKHYSAIADACPVPVLLYNVPSRTGTNIVAATTLRLSSHPNIIGIKEASGDLVQCIEIAQGKADDFLLISGEDILTLPMLAIGGLGVISTIANGFPKAMSQLVDWGLKENFAAARPYMSSLLPVCQFISQIGNPVGTKQMLSELGICQPHVRSPLTISTLPLPEEVHHILSQEEIK